MIAGGKGVYQAESVDVPTHPIFRVRYPGTGRQTWVLHRKVGDSNIQTTVNVIRGGAPYWDYFRTPDHPELEV
ncbi:MAG: hypothetical protein ABSF46_25680 [Terriglobia bacterium]